MRTGFLPALLLLVGCGNLVTVENPDDRSPGDITTGPLSGMDFAYIPSGSFSMGSPTSESNRESNEDQHRVTVGSFELMTTEVTQGMWEEVMGDSIEELRDIANPDWPLRGVGDDYPVYYVSWDDCQAFLYTVNHLDTEYEYRLPTEAEWEYACRAGAATAYYWGGSMSGSYCWYAENSNDSAHPVGQKLPNAWGLYDMSGNVWEWCEDMYTSDYEDCPTNGAAYTGSGSYFVNRGGSWYNNARYCRSAVRFYYSPSSSSYSLGFRLARTAL